jgi:hypothetical protein
METNPYQPPTTPPERPAWNGEITLVEMLVIVAAIGIIAAITLPA